MYTLLTGDEFDELVADLAGLKVFRPGRNNKLLPAGTKAPVIETARSQLQAYIRRMFLVSVDYGGILAVRPHEVSIEGGSLQTIIAAFCMKVHKEIFFERSTVVVRRAQQEPEITAEDPMITVPWFRLRGWWPFIMHSLAISIYILPDPSSYPQ